MTYKSTIKTIRKKIKQLDIKYMSAWTAAIAAALFVLTWRLSSITSGNISPIEQATMTSSGSWHAIIANPLFLPYKLLVWMSLHLGGTHSAFTLRLPSVILGLISLWLFLSIARRWFTRPTYVLSSIIFGSSLWMLHYGRLAVPQITLVLAPLVIMQTLVWLRRLKWKEVVKGFRLFILAPVIALTLYIPGVWLFWLAVAIWQRKRLILVFKKLPRAMSLEILALTLVLLAPLLYSFSQDTSLITSWLGINTSSIFSWHRLSLFVWQPIYHIAYGPAANPAQWLGRQAILDAFSAAMVLGGVYYYIRNYKLRQAKLLAIFLATGLLLFVLSDGALNLWPGLIYLLAAAGIGYLIGLWKKVFPRNPIAYGFAVCLAGVATLFVVFYTAHSYFTVWHHNPKSNHAFSIKL